MTDEMKNNLELRRKIMDLCYSISGDIDHGECFYDEDMLNVFCKDLDRVKALALEYYNSNKEELDED